MRLSYDSTVQPIVSGIVMVEGAVVVNVGPLRNRFYELCVKYDVRR